MKEIVKKLQEMRLKSSESDASIEKIDEDLRDDMIARRKAAHEKKVAFRKAAEEEIRKSDDPLRAAFDQYVPESGPSKNLGGEAVRAMMKILYRDQNDGDVFYQGYGVETCADAVAYLCDLYPELESSFEDIAMRTLEGGAYTKALKEISKELMDILYGREAFLQSNTEDYQDWDGEDFIEDKGWEPEYEIDIDISDNVLAHLDADNITIGDVESEVDGWIADSPEAVVRSYSSYSISVSGLRRDDYDNLDNYGNDWMDQYGEDLNNEYGNPEDEESDDEEDED